MGRGRCRQWLASGLRFTGAGRDVEFPVHIPFVEHLGLQLLQWADGVAEVAFEPRPEHMNSFDVLHGGLCMTLLDVAMASAARSVQPDMGAVTVEMKTSFFCPAQGALRARGEVLHRSATLAFVEAQLLDAQGQCCAHGTATFKLVPRLPVGRKSTRASGVFPSD